MCGREQGEREPVVLSRGEHGISRKQIDADALKVLYRLHRHGYRAYLVGGGVRDLLLGKTPKDFDVGTDARPEQVRTLFRNSRIIGRRFRMNHVYFAGNKIIEVCTFRAGDTGFDPEDEPTRVMPDNIYGTPETDAARRDLTINGLFYDVGDFSVIDFVGGVRDLRDGVIRIIGDPETRIKEDPVRMIRAVRHAARTGFQFDPLTYDAVVKLPQLISICPKMRVFEEFTRELRGGHALESLRLMEETGLLKHLMPELADALARRGEEVRPHLEEVLRRMDGEAGKGRELSPAVLFLALCFDSFSADRFADDQKVTEHIEELFHPIGVSRRERERMAHVLGVRSKLFERFDEHPRLTQTEREVVGDALDLIGLTASEVVRDRSYRRWQSLLRSRPPQQRGAPRRRGRRRRRGAAQGNM